MLLAILRVTCFLIVDTHKAFIVQRSLTHRTAILAFLQVDDGCFCGILGVFGAVWSSYGGVWGVNDSDLMCLNGRSERCVVEI